MKAKKGSLIIDGLFLLLIFVFFGLGIALGKQSEKFDFEQVEVKAYDQQAVLVTDALKGNGELVGVRSETENFTVYKLIEGKKVFVLTGEPTIGETPDSTIFSAVLNMEMENIYVFSMDVKVFSNTDFSLLKSEIVPRASKRDLAVFCFFLSVVLLCLLAYRQFEAAAWEKWRI